MFTPDRNWLASFWPRDKLRLWRLPGRGSPEIRELDIGFLDARSLLAIDPAGKRFFVTGYGGSLSVHSLEDGGFRRLEGFSNNTLLQQGAFSPSGRLAAAATAWSSEEQVLRVWDLDSGEIEVFALPQPVHVPEGESGSSSGSVTPSVESLAFSNESTLFTAGRTGVLRWNLEAGTHVRIASAGAGGFAQLWLSRDRQQLITLAEDPANDECSSLVLHDLKVGSARVLNTFVRYRDGPSVRQVAFDDTLSAMAVGRLDGTIWAGRVESGSPHLLMGHQGSIEGLAISPESPDGRWIASSGEDSPRRAR